jgi:hypothetical protein
MRVNKDMLKQLRRSLGFDHLKVSQFGKDLKVNYYDKNRGCGAELGIPVSKIENQIGKIDLLDKSLKNRSSNQIGLIANSRKVQRIRKVRRSGRIDPTHEK